MLSRANLELNEHVVMNEFAAFKFVKLMYRHRCNLMLLISETK